MLILSSISSAGARIQGTATAANAAPQNKSFLS